jgi:hypothetical protein
LADVEVVLPEPVTLGAEAREVWRRVEARIETLAEVPGLSDAWRGHLGKWPGYAARLFLLTHLLDHLEEIGVADTIQVSGQTAQRAEKLVGWLLANSLRFYMTCIGGGEAGDDARWVAGYILSRSVSGSITRRDIGQARNALRDPDRAVRCMRFLEANDWCVSASQKVDRHGPTEWTICPEVHDGRFASRAESELTRRQREREKIAAAVRERKALFGEVVDVG